MTSRSTQHRVFALAAVILATACGSGMLDVGHPTAPSGGGGVSVGTPANYFGVLADSLKHGKINISVTAGLSATGVLTFIGGPTVPVTGTVDTVAQEITVTGGGYTVHGFRSLGTIFGDYTGPGVSGLLAASSDTLTHLSHTLYCGVYTSTNGNGWISMDVLGDGETGGIAVQTVGRASSTTFVGTLVGNLTFSATTNLAAPIAGTLSGQTITGTYAPAVGSTTGTGTFSASTGGC